MHHVPYRTIPRKVLKQNGRKLDKVQRPSGPAQMLKARAGEHEMQTMTKLMKEGGTLPVRKFVIRAIEIKIANKQHTRQLKVRLDKSR